jgi:hypothetical protein
MNKFPSTCKNGRWALALRLALALCLVLALAGCGGATEARDTLTGELPDILATVLSDAGELLDEQHQLAQSFEDPVTAENCQGMLGLSPDDFQRLVAEAYSSTAAIITAAHEVTLVRCNDFSAAAEVKQLVSEGFNPAKWICVPPEQCYTVDSGSYVLLVASTDACADAIAEAFRAAADGNVGETDVFYTHSVQN